LGFGVKFKNGKLIFRFEEVSEVVIKRQERVRGRRLRRVRIFMGENGMRREKGVGIH